VRSICSWGAPPVTLMQIDSTREKEARVLRSASDEGKGGEIESLVNNARRETMLRHRQKRARQKSRKQKDKLPFLGKNEQFKPGDGRRESERAIL